MVGKLLIVLDVGGIITNLTTVSLLEMKHVYENTYLGILTAETI